MDRELCREMEIVVGYFEVKDIQNSEVNVFLKCISKMIACSVFILPWKEDTKMETNR